MGNWKCLFPVDKRCSAPSFFLLDVVDGVAAEQAECEIQIQ
ncbi:MAG: hypothetical protein O3A95_03410 [Planctomycetota bacterium]|nr:hypothetical protein [Planctomycetota bacterium]MDA1113329.1 hypothetical protein [Planctomycetota bacterium]